MQPEQAGKLRGRVGLILFFAAAAGIWWGLDRAEPRADWLRVEGPRQAVAGQPLSIRVYLAQPSEPGYLSADLHWGTSRDKPLVFLATGGAKAVGQGGGRFDFEIMVSPRPGLRFVSGVIYLGRTADWADRKLAVSTELIPVVSDTPEQRETRLEPLRLRPTIDGSRDHPRPAAIPRWLTGLLFLAVLVTAWGAVPSTNALKAVPDPGKRWWQVWVVLLALACLWEIFGLESWLGAQARAMAHAGELYYLRGVLQKVVISVAVAVTVPFFLFIQRARDSRRLLLVSFALYLVISAVHLVSLHVIDEVAELSWHGLTVVQALKLGCATMVLVGVRRARRVQR